MSCGGNCGCGTDAQPTQPEQEVPQTEDTQEASCCREDGQCACKSSEEIV